MKDPPGMAHILRDGTEVEDPRLGRLIQFDERSRAYPLAAVIDVEKPRSYTWRIDTGFIIDQGREGACVGLAVVNELQARPAEVRFGGEAAANMFAVRSIYWEAKKIDPWEGEAYEGTSVLAGVTVAQRLGYFEEYRWAFGLDDLVLGIGRHGPAILGLNWFETNYTPDAAGFIRPEGQWVGGHAILARAVKVVWRDGMSWDEHGWDAVDLDRSYITQRNSWGPWGHRGSGDCYVTLRDMGRWLDQQGEAVFAVRRTTEPDT